MRTLSNSLRSLENSETPAIAALTLGDKVQRAQSILPFFFFPQEHTFLQGEEKLPLPGTACAVVSDSLPAAPLGSALWEFQAHEEVSTWLPPSIKAEMSVLS